jgi:lipid II:glycine glycyltransferase (peptidoglycan interpeptide bridge formation enzyme)
MIIRKITSKEKDEYNLHVIHPLQAWEWGEFKTETGLEVERFGLFDQGKFLKAWQVTFSSLPLGFSVGYFPKGPVPDKGMVEAVKEVAREKRAIYVKFEPEDIQRRYENIKGKINSIPIEENKTEYQKFNLIDAEENIFSQHTFVLDISKDQRKLMENMHPKTRYNIRLSERKGVRVLIDNSTQALETFIKLLFEDTVERQGFYMHNPDYFRLLFKHMSSMANIFIAKKGTAILGAWMIFNYKDRIFYPYGASSSSMRNLMASNLLCWEAIKYGQSIGAKKFDMWGSMGPDPDISHPWYGFHRFKQGYGGELIKSSGAWDLVANSVLYTPALAANKARWKLLRLKKKASSRF